MTFQVTIDFDDEEEARAFFAMVCASRQDLVPMVWRGRGINLKYAELRSATNVRVERKPASDH